MSTSAISVENLSKAYRIGLKEDVPDSLVGAVQGLVAAPLKNWRRLRSLNTFGAALPGRDDEEDLVWALRDVSFEVEEGEVLGIIGRNGAGKSTLLKILSRITEPTSGRAVIRGRVSSLLEVGTGFHPELSGRENIYLNGTILGMTKREIDRKFDEIVDFSGVERFLDTPIKRYSSGMKVRLAFSVAAHLEPEILIIDEVLAVGDVGFQKKCLSSMRNLRQRGGTVLIVTHDMGVVTSLCKSAILLESGRLSAIGDPASQVQQYAASLSMRSHEDLAERRDRIGSGSIRIGHVCFQNGEGRPIDVALAGEPLRISIGYQSHGLLDVVDAYIWITDECGTRLSVLCNRISGDELRALPASGEVVCNVDNLPLCPGQYMLDTTLVHAGELADGIYGATRLSVEPGPFFTSGKTPARSHGAFLIQHNWIQSSPPLSTALDRCLS